MLEQVFEQAAGDRGSKVGLGVLAPLEGELPDRLRMVLDERGELDDGCPTWVVVTLGSRYTWEYGFGASDRAAESGGRWRWQMCHGAMDR